MIIETISSKNQLINCVNGKKSNTIKYKLKKLFNEINFDDFNAQIFRKPREENKK